MSRDEAVIKATLDLILTHTYENHQCYKSYHIRIVPRELSSKHGHYKSREAKIEIFNLARPPIHTLLTCLHELAHHVETIDYGQTGHDESFYLRFYQLLKTGIGLHYLSPGDIETEKDSSDKAYLTSYFGSSFDWDIPQFELNEAVIVSVKNGFRIRQLLKQKRFKWFSISQTWEKEFENRHAADLVLHDIVPLLPLEDVVIRPKIDLPFITHYYLGVLNGYDYRYGLREMGYVWEGYGVNNMWVKQVLAQEYYDEIVELSKFDGVEYKKVTPDLDKAKRKREKAQKKPQSFKKKKRKIVPEF